MPPRIGKIIPNERGGGKIKIKCEGMTSGLTYDKENNVYGKIKSRNRDDDNSKKTDELQLKIGLSRNLNKSTLKNTIPTTSINNSLKNIKLYGLSDTSDRSDEINFADLSTFGDSIKVIGFNSLYVYYQYHVHEINLDTNNIKLVGYIYQFISDFITYLVLFQKNDIIEGSLKTYLDLFDTVNDIINPNTTLEILAENLFVALNKTLTFLRYIDYIFVGVKIIADKYSSDLETIITRALKNKTLLLNEVISDFVKDDPVITEPDTTYEIITAFFGYYRSIITNASKIEKINEILLEIRTENKLNNLSKIITNTNSYHTKKIITVASLIPEVINKLNEKRDIIYPLMTIIVNLFIILINHKVNGQTWDEDNSKTIELITNIIKMHTTIITADDYEPIYTNSCLPNIKIMIDNKTIDFGLLKQYMDNTINICQILYTLVTLQIRILKSSCGDITNEVLNKTISAYNNDSDNKDLYICMPNNIFNYLDIKYEDTSIDDINKLFDKPLKDIVNRKITLKVKEKFRYNDSNFKIFNTEEGRLCYIHNLNGGGIPSNNFKCFYNFNTIIELGYEDKKMPFLYKNFNLTEIPDYYLKYNNSYMYIGNNFKTLTDKLDKLITNGKCGEVLKAPNQNNFGTIQTSVGGLPNQTFITLTSTDFVDE